MRSAVWIATRLPSPTFPDSPGGPITGNRMILSSWQETCGLDCPSGSLKAVTSEKVRGSWYPGNRIPLSCENGW